MQVFFPLGHLEVKQGTASPCDLHAISFPSPQIRNESGFIDIRR